MLTKEQKRQYNEKWKAKNPDYYSQWYLRNKERVAPLNKAYRKKYNADPVNKKRRAKYQKEYEENNPDKKEYRYFLTRRANAGFELSFEDYKKLIGKQKGVCEICSKKDNNRALTIDHCHKTNKVRGLLCKKCNTAIGMLADDKELVKKAYNYLKKYDK